MPPLEDLCGLWGTRKGPRSSEHGADMDEYEPIAKIWISGSPPHIRMRARLAWGEILQYCQTFDTADRARRHMEAFATAEQINTDDWQPVYFPQPRQHRLPETDTSLAKNASGKYVVPPSVGVPDYGIIPELHCTIDLDSLPAFEDNQRSELALHFPRIVKHAPSTFRPSRMDIAHVEWRLRMGWLT